MGFGFLRADKSFFHQPTYVGVIVGEAGDRGIAHQVQAAVPDMRVVEKIAEQGGRGTGRPHAVQFGMFASVLQDALVRRVESG